MIDDLVHNPALAAKVILGQDIRDMPPHERIRFKLAWVSKFVLDHSGFSTAKTFSIAALAALRIILLDPYRVQGVVSRTFGQGKVVGDYWLRWLDTSKIFASQIKKRPVATGGIEYDFIRGASGWYLTSRNGSSAKIIPPDLMKKGGRLASERFSDGYFDEIHKWPDQNIIELVMHPRVTKPVSDPLHPIYQHHFYNSSTAGFKYEPAYERVARYLKEMSLKNEKYSVLTFNFRDVPDKPQFHALVDMDVLKNMELSLPDALFRAEGLGEWVDDSMGTYSAKLVSSIRRPEAKIQYERQHDDEQFICGIDVAHGGAQGQGDDSSIQILKKFRGTLSLVWSVELHSVRLEQIAAAVHEIDMRYGLSIAVLDPGGGGLWLRDSLINDRQIINGNQSLVIPITTHDDDRVVDARRILVFFKRGTPEIDDPEIGIFGKMSLDSMLVNRAHISFKNSFEKQFIAAPLDLKYEDDATLGWLSTHDAYLRCRQCIDKTFVELIGIEVERDPDTGKVKKDSAGMMKYISRIRKDRAYAFMYSYMGVLILEKMADFDAHHDSNSVVATATEVNLYGGESRILQDPKHVKDIRGSVSSHYPKLG